MQRSKLQLLPPLLTLHLNLLFLALSVEKVSSRNWVPGAKKVGDHCSKQLKCIYNNIFKTHGLSNATKFKNFFKILFLKLMN